MAFRRYQHIDKDKWEADYKMRYPNRSSFYKYVSDKNEAKEEYLRDVYHDKCIYCGMNLKKVPLSFCEIDHVRPQKGNETLIQSLGNLVCSCRTCNRTKSKESISIVPHPDEAAFSEYFTRNDKYEIIPSHVDPQKALKVIEILGFDKRQHKLTYLYDELNIMKMQVTSPAIKCMLYELIEKLDEVRNREM